MSRSVATINKTASMVTIRTVDDLANAERLVGLPVGPRGLRTKEKQEWYVLLKFLQPAIPAGVFELPVDIRCGTADATLPEPDFVVSRAGTDDVAALVEITEATNEADQREMTLSQRSDKIASLLGEFGGRFSDGASHPEITWASDIIDSVRRKDGKTIFMASPVQRHLLVYPNSNASMLMSDEDDERQGIEHLREHVANDEALLRRITNGCSIHILGGYIVCLDALGEATVIGRRAD
jgi:hypothetical protein